MRTAAPSTRLAASPAVFAVILFSTALSLLCGAISLGLTHLSSGHPPRLFLASVSDFSSHARSDFLRLWLEATEATGKSRLLYVADTSPENAVLVRAHLQGKRSASQQWPSTVAELEQQFGIGEGAMEIDYLEVSRATPQDVARIDNAAGIYIEMGETYYTLFQLRVHGLEGAA